MLYAGNLYTGEAQVALGDHSEKTAWYASATGSRSNYGLATPVTAIYHDATNSESGFVSLIRNQTAKDQLRVDGQYRQDYFQVPYDPSQNDYECPGGSRLLLLAGACATGKPSAIRSRLPTGCTRSHPRRWCR